MELLNKSLSNASNIERELYANRERELVSAKTLAMIIDAQESTIRDWVLDGKIPYVKMPTGALRFHLPTVRKWYQPGMVDAR